jgi:hypothetical protein
MIASHAMMKRSNERPQQLSTPVIQQLEIVGAQADHL